MTTITEISNHSRLAKLGWGILLVISALLLLNGVTWFFIGPRLSWIEELGILDEFRQTYPAIADNYATNARQVAIWYLAFGLLALLVTLEGFRHRSRWAWYATWVLVAVLAAIGLLYRDGFGIYSLGLAAIALVGQLLAGKGLSSKANETVETPYDKKRL
jgi:hypothetical protein